MLCAGCPIMESLHISIPFKIKVQMIYKLMLVSGVQQNAPHKIYYKMITLTGPSYQLTAYTTVFNYYNFVVELTSESVMPPAYQVCSSFSRLF